MSSEAVLALDVGQARIGLARGERGSAFAFPRGWLTRSGNLKADVAAVREAAGKEQAGLLVVGLPLRSGGGDSQQTERVRAFAAALEAAGLRVELQDERFTSKLASQQIARGPRSRRSRQQKGLEDEAAAVLILETWLQRQGAGL